MSFLKISAFTILASASAMGGSAWASTVCGQLTSSERGLSLKASNTGVNYLTVPKNDNSAIWTQLVDLTDKGKLVCVEGEIATQNGKNYIEVESVTER